jgi:phage recombination protein Bet
MSNALAISQDQTTWDARQLAALKHLKLSEASPGDLALFLHTCQRSGLDPFARQIYLIRRGGGWTIQTGIDGFRLVARRVADASGEVLGYEDTVWCGEDGVWRDVWLAKQPPAAAKVVVLRGAGRFSAVALFDEYKAVDRSGALTSFWATKPALMLAKCAEALALRRAFPQDLSGLYTAEEMAQADNPGPPRQEDRDGLIRRTIQEVRLARGDDPALGAIWRNAQAHGILDAPTPDGELLRDVILQAREMLPDDGAVVADTTAEAVVEGEYA